MSAKTKKIIKWAGVFIALLAFWMVLMCGAPMLHAEAKPPSKSKFYDFGEQLIDGEIRKPQAIYTDSRARVKFERLLKLKRSFMRDLMQTSKEKVFK
jgi:hypothetical protein